MSFANSESFTSFLIWIPFISFSVLIAVANLQVTAQDLPSRCEVCRRVQPSLPLGGPRAAGVRTPGWLGLN